MVPARWRILPGWAVVLGATAALWVVGFLPWVVEGLRLPSSAAWPGIRTIEGPRVALPFGEQGVTTLLVSGVVGGTASLCVSLLAAPRVTRARVLAAAGGAMGLLAALAQTWATVRPGLARTDEATLLLAGLVAATVGSGVLGLLVGAGVARGRGWPWLLGGATAAAVAGSWLVDVVDRGPGSVPSWLGQVLQWHPWLTGALLGGVLAVFGREPVGRLIGWVVALAIAWVVPSVFTAVTYAVAYAGQGTLTSSHRTEVLDAGRDVFVQSLSPDGRSLGPLVLAVVLGLVGSGRRRP